MPATRIFGTNTSTAIIIWGIGRCPAPSRVISPPSTGRSWHCSGSAPQPGKPLPGMSSSAGVRAAEKPICRWSQTTPGFSSCPGCSAPTSPRTCSQRSPGNCRNSGTAVIAFVRYCLKRSLSSVSKGPAIAPPTGSMLAKPKDAANAQSQPNQHCRPRTSGSTRCAGTSGKYSTPDWLSAYGLAEYLPFLNSKSWVCILHKGGFDTRLILIY